VLREAACFPGTAAHNSFASLCALPPCSCAGNGYVIELVNSHMAVYDTSGAQLAFVALASFIGTPPSIAVPAAGAVPIDPR
jgi:hypothetical protein